MPGTMTLQVISPECTVVKNLTTDAVVIPVTEGSMGILYNHAPMVATLRIGVLRYKDGGVYKRIAISGGFMELSSNSITVLADSAELGESVDVMRAREARRRAESRLRERASNTDRVRAEIALRRAISRLKAAGVIEDGRE